MSTDFKKVPVPPSVLGEGPVWSVRHQCLYFVDIMSGRVQAYWPSSERYEYWQFDKFTGAVAECESGGLIVALSDQVIWFDPKQGLESIQEIVALEQDRPENRLNDGKVDPWGRFWVGSMNLEEKDATGRLWCVTPAGNVSLELNGIVVSNSLAFDRQNKQIYFADSPSKTIRRGTFNDAHELMGWEPFARGTKGYPDGSCLDADGYLWNAEWLGSRIVRYAPSGKIDRVLPVPASRPSCCAFGGSNLDVLYVTTAQYKMSESEKEKDPHAGSLFAIEINDVRGQPADLFGR